MIMNLYSIYDCAAKEYGPVFEAKNDKVAERKCKMEFKNVPYVGDFELHYVGQFDHSTGSIVINAADVSPCLLSLADLFIEENNK